MQWRNGYFVNGQTSFEAQLVKANLEIKQTQVSVSTGQTEIVRLTAALNRSEQSNGLKTEEFAMLNAAYNGTIKILDDKKQVNTPFILLISDLECQLAIERKRTFINNSDGNVVKILSSSLTSHIIKINTIGFNRPTTLPYNQSS